MSTPLCLWSGPRNLSTAMMRSFGARSDTRCWDEPFFAAFLDRTGLDHPGRAETLAQCETNPERVCERLLAPVETPYHFQKHMAHHMLPDFPTLWMDQARHVFLLRHPARVIASYAKGRANFTTDDLGFSALRRLHDQLSERRGKAPLIIDDETILRKPEASLRHLCEVGFEIPYDPAMLSWDAGPRPEDGPWAPYWYSNVHASTGFGSPPARLPDISENHQTIYQRCLTDYEVLRSQSVRASITI